MSELACPKCHQPLILRDHSYYCKNNHCYDIAKRQYINLLLNPDKATNNPGDSKESLIHRRDFLNKGYYDVILNEVINNINEPVNILDLGCGEGYYTAKLKQQFPDCDVYGLDISKTAINMATHYRKDIYWLVGNSKNLPINDHSIDYMTALFTVINEEEIRRVLKKEGIMIHIIANNTHLIEFKELIYDEVKIKSNEHIKLSLPIIRSYDYKKTIHLNNHDDTLNLLSMTPHYYHIKKDKRSLLDTLAAFDVTIDINITAYKNEV